MVVDGALLEVGSNFYGSTTHRACTPIAVALFASV